MVPGQEVNGENLGKYFQSSIQLWYVVCTPKNRLDEAILMSTHNIHLHDETRKFP